MEEELPTSRKRRKTMKMLAKEKTKMSDWMNMNKEVPEENQIQIKDAEIETEADQPDPEIL